MVIVLYFLDFFHQPGFVSYFEFCICSTISWILVKGIVTSFGHLIKMWNSSCEKVNLVRLSVYSLIYININWSLK